MFNSTLVCYSMGVVISFWVENQFKTNKNRNCYSSLSTLFCLLTNLGKLKRNLLLVLNKAFYFGNCSALTFKNLYSILCSFLFFFCWHATLQNVLYVFFTKFTKTRRGSHFSTAPGAVYRSIDGTFVANQIANLRDSGSLRYANII